MSNSVKTTLQERALSIFRAFMAIVLTIGLGIPAAGLQALSNTAWAAEGGDDAGTAESQGVQVSIVNNPKIDIVVAGKNTTTINETATEEDPNKLLNDVREILERDYEIDAKNVLSMNVKTVETQTSANKTEKATAEEIKRRFKIIRWPTVPHTDAFTTKQTIGTPYDNSGGIGNFNIDDMTINGKKRPTIYMSTSNGYNHDEFVDTENYVSVTNGTDFEATYETTFGATNQLGNNTTDICGEAFYWFKLSEDSKTGYGLCFDNHTGCGFFPNNDNTIYFVKLENGQLYAPSTSYVAKFTNWKKFPEFGVKVTEVNGKATIQIWPNPTTSGYSGLVSGAQGGSGDFNGTYAEYGQNRVNWTNVDVAMYDTPFTQAYGFWVFAGIYFSDSATTMKRTVTKSFGDILDEPEWTDGALRLLVNMDTKKDNTLAGKVNGKDNLAANSTRLLADNVHLIQWGSDENRADAERLIKANKGNGAFFYDLGQGAGKENQVYSYQYEGGAEPRNLGITSTAYQDTDPVNGTGLDSSGKKVIYDNYYKGLLDKFVRYLVDHIGQNKRTNTVYVNEPFMVNVVPESLKYDAVSNQYPAGRWRFYHNPYVYDEIDKKDPYDASVKRDEKGNVVDGWSDYSPEMTCEFEKPGQYIIQFDDKDILEINAQRRAKADFDISVDTDGQFHFEHKSYDYDKYNTKTEYGRGIKSAEFSYQITRQINHTDGTTEFKVEDWVEGTPESYDSSVYTYTIRLKVMDFQAQSDSDAVTCTKYIGNGIPVASYTINDTTLTTNESLDIVNKSYDPTAIAPKAGVSSKITKYTWDLINDAGQVKNQKYHVEVNQAYANTYLGGDMTKFPVNAFNLKQIATDLDGPNATTSEATYRLRLIVTAEQTVSGKTEAVDSMPYIQAFTLSNPRITNTVVHKARVVADDGTPKDITLKTTNTTVEEGKTTNVGQLLLKSSFYPTGFEAPTTYTYSYNDAAGNRQEKTNGNSVPLVQTANPQTIELVYLAQNPKINYNVNGGSFDNGVTLAKSYQVGTQVTVPTPKRTGYTFNGWKDTLTATEYPVDENDPSVTYINKDTNILDAKTIDDLHAATYGKTTSKLNLKAMWTVKQPNVSYGVSDIQLPNEDGSLSEGDQVTITVHAENAEPDTILQTATLKFDVPDWLHVDDMVMVVNENGEEETISVDPKAYDETSDPHKVSVYLGDIDGGTSIDFTFTATVLEGADGELSIVPILMGHTPKAYSVKDGKLTGDSIGDATGVIKGVINTTGRIIAVDGDKTYIVGDIDANDVVTMRSTGQILGEISGKDTSTKINNKLDRELGIIDRRILIFGADNNKSTTYLTSKNTGVVNTLANKSTQLFKWVTFSRVLNKTTASKTYMSDNLASTVWTNSVNTGKYGKYLKVDFAKGVAYAAKDSKGNMEANAPQKAYLEFKEVQILNELGTPNGNLDATGMIWLNNDEGTPVETGRLDTSGRVLNSNGAATGIYLNMIGQLIDSTGKVYGQLDITSGNVDTPIYAELKSDVDGSRLGAFTWGVNLYSTAKKVSNSNSLGMLDLSKQNVVVDINNTSKEKYTISWDGALVDEDAYHISDLEGGNTVTADYADDMGKATVSLIIGADNYAYDKETTVQSGYVDKNQVLHYDAATGAVAEAKSYATVKDKDWSASRTLLKVTASANAVSEYIVAGSKDKLIGYIDRSAKIYDADDEIIGDVDIENGKIKSITINKKIYTYDDKTGQYTDENGHPYGYVDPNTGEIEGPGTSSGGVDENTPIYDENGVEIGYYDKDGVPHFYKVPGDPNSGLKDNSDSGITAGTSDKEGGEVKGTTIKDGDEEIGTEDNFGDDDGDSKITIYDKKPGQVEPDPDKPFEGGKVIEVNDKGQITKFEYNGVTYVVNPEATKNVTDKVDDKVVNVKALEFWAEKNYVNGEFKNGADGYITLPAEAYAGNTIVMYKDYYVDPDGKIHETEEGTETIQAPTKSFVHDGKTYYIDWSTKKFYEKEDFSGDVKGWIDDFGTPHFIKDGTVGEKGDDGKINIRGEEDDKGNTENTNPVTDDKGNPIGESEDNGDNTQTVVVNPGGDNGEGGEPDTGKGKIKPGTPITDAEGNPIGQVDDVDKDGNITEFTYNNVKYYVNPETHEFHQNPDYSDEAVGYVDSNNEIHFYEQKSGNVDLDSKPPKIKDGEEEKGDITVDPVTKEIVSFTYDGITYYVNPDSDIDEFWAAAKVEFKDGKPSKFKGGADGYIGKDGKVHFYDQNIVSDVDPGPAEADIKPGTPITDDNGVQRGQVDKVDNKGNITEFTYDNVKYYVNPETREFHQNPDYSDEAVGYVDKYNGVHFYDKNNTGKVDLENDPPKITFGDDDEGEIKVDDGKIVSFTHGDKTYYVKPTSEKQEFWEASKVTFKDEKPITFNGTPDGYIGDDGTVHFYDQSKESEVEPGPAGITPGTEIKEGGEVKGEVKAVEDGKIKVFTYLGTTYYVDLSHTEKDTRNDQEVDSYRFWSNPKFSDDPSGFITVEGNHIVFYDKKLYVDEKGDVHEVDPSGDIDPDPKDPNETPKVWNIHDGATQIGTYTDNGFNHGTVALNNNSEHEGTYFAAQNGAMFPVTAALGKIAADGNIVKSATDATVIGNYDNGENNNISHIFFTGDKSSYDVKDNVLFKDGKTAGYIDWNGNIFTVGDKVAQISNGSINFIKDETIGTLGENGDLDIKTGENEGGNTGEGTDVKDKDGNVIGTETDFGDDDDDSKLVIEVDTPGKVDPDPDKPFEGGKVIEVNDKGEITKFEYNNVTYVVNPAAVKDVDDNKKTVKANEFWAEKNYVDGKFMNGADGYITLPGDGYAGNKIVMYKDYYVDPDGKIHETEEGENPVTPAADNTFQYDGKTYYVDPDTGKFYDNKDLNPPVKGWLDEFGIPHFIKDTTVGEKGENGEIDIRTGEDEKGGEGGGSTITNPDDPDNPIGSEDDFGDDKGDSKVDIFGGDAGDVDDEDVIKKDGVEIGKVDVREEGTNKIKEFTYDGTKYYVDTTDVTETPEGSEEAVTVNKFWKNDKFDGDASGYIILENEHIVFYTQHYYVDPDGKVHETEEGPETIQAPTASFTHDGKTYYIDWTTKKFYEKSDFSGKTKGWIDDEGHPHFIKDGTVGEKGENGDLDIRTGEDEPSGESGETVITDPETGEPIGSETDFGDDDDDSKLDIFGGEGGNVNNDDDNIYKDGEVIGKVLDRDEATDKVTKFSYDGTIYYVDINNNVQETPEGYDGPKTANKFYKNQEFSGDAAGYILLDNGCIFFYTQHYYIDPEGNIHETEAGDDPVTPGEDHSFKYGDPEQTYWVDPETGKFYDNEKLEGDPKGWIDEDGIPHFIKDEVVGKKDKETGDIDLNSGEDADKTGETEPSGEDGKFQVGDVIKDGEGNPIGSVTGVDKDGNISEFTYGKPAVTYVVNPDTGDFYSKDKVVDGKFTGLPDGWVDENGGIHFYKKETAKASYINIYDSDENLIGIAYLDDETGKINKLEITQEGDRKGTYNVENNKIYDKETGTQVVGDIDGAGVVRWHSTEGGSIATGKVENDIKIYKDGVQIGVALLNDEGEITKLKITGPEGDSRIGEYDVKDGKIIDVNKIIKPNNSGSNEVGTISKTGEISWFDLNGGTVVSGGSSTDEKTLTDDEGSKIGVANVDNGHIVKFTITSGDNQGTYYVNPESAKHEFWAANEDGSAPDFTGKALGYVDYDNNDKIYFYDFTTGTKSDQIKITKNGEVVGYADLDENGNIWHFTTINPYAEYWVDTETGKFYDNEDLNPPVKGTIDKNGNWTLYKGDDVVAGGDATEQTIVDPETGKTIGTKKDFEDGTSKITLIDENGNKTEYFKNTDNKLYNWTDETDEDGKSKNPKGKAVGEIDPVTGKITIYGTTTVLDKDKEGNLTANGDDLGDKENDDNEIIDPTTGKPIGQIDDDGDLTLNTGDEKDGGDVDTHTTIITGGKPERQIGTNTDFGDKKGDSHITITGENGDDDEEYYVDQTKPVGNVYGTEKGGPVTVGEDNEFKYGVDPEKTYVVDPTTGKFYDKDAMPEEGGYPEKPAGWIDPDGTIHIIDYTDYTEPAGVGTFDKETGKLDIDDTRGKDKGTVDTDKDIIKDPETKEPIGEKTDLGDGTDVITTPGEGENPGETLYVDKEGNVFGTTDGGNVSNDPAMVGPKGEKNGTYTPTEDPDDGWKGELTFTDPEAGYIVDDHGNIYTKVTEKDPEGGDPVVKPGDKVGFITDDGEIHWINEDDPAGKAKRDEDGNLTNVEIRTGMVYGGHVDENSITNAEGGKIGETGNDAKFKFTFSYTDQAFNYREQSTYYVSDDVFSDGSDRFYNSDKSELFGLIDKDTGNIYFYKYTKGNVTDEHPLTDDDGKEIGTATTDKDGNIKTVTIGDDTYYVGGATPAGDGSKYLYDNKDLKGDPVGEIDKDNKVKLYTVVNGTDTGEHPVYDETGEPIGTATTDKNGKINKVTVGDDTYFVDGDNQLYVWTDEKDKDGNSLNPQGKPVGKIDPETGKITMYDIVNGGLEHDTGLKDKEGNDIGDKDDEGNTNLDAEELGKEKNDLEEPWQYIVDGDGHIIGKYNPVTGEIVYYDENGQPGVTGNTGTDINIKGDPDGPAGTPDKDGNITVGGENLGGEDGTFIVDPETGEIIGKINEDGTITYYDPYPKTSGTGTTERGSEVVDPETGKKVSDEDEEGNITVPSGNIGSNEDGKFVVDENGNIIGKINEDGTITYYDPYPTESGTGDVTNKTVVTDEEGNVIGEKIDNGDGTSTVIIYGDPDQIYVIDEDGNIHDATDGGNIKDDPENITGPEGEEGGKYTPNNDDPKDPSGTITFGGDTPDDPDDDKTYIVDKDGNIHEQDTPGVVDPGSKVKDEKGDTIGTYTPNPDNEDGKYLPGTLVLTGDPDDPNDDKTYTVDDKGDIHDPSITNTENGGGGNVKEKPEDITGPHGEQGGVYTPTGNPDDPDNGLTGEIKFTDPAQTYTVDPDGTIKDEKGNEVGKVDENGGVTWTDVIGKYDPETGDITIGGKTIGTDSGEHDILDPETNEPIGTATDTDRDGDIDKIVIPGDPKADPPTKDKTYDVDDKGNLHETTEGGNAKDDPENITGPNGEKGGKYEKSNPENGLEGTITFENPKEEFKVDDKGNITDEKGDKVGEIDPETGVITWIDPDPSGKIDPGTGKIEIEGEKVGEVDPETGDIIWIDKDTDGKHIVWTGTLTEKDGNKIEMEGGKLEVNGEKYHFDFDGNVYNENDERVGYLDITGEMYLTVPENKDLGHLDWVVEMRDSDGNVIADLSNQVILKDTSGNEKYVIDGDGTIRDADVYKGTIGELGADGNAAITNNGNKVGDYYGSDDEGLYTIKFDGDENTYYVNYLNGQIHKTVDFSDESIGYVNSKNDVIFYGDKVGELYPQGVTVYPPYDPENPQPPYTVISGAEDVLTIHWDLGTITNQDDKLAGYLKWNVDFENNDRWHHVATDKFAEGPVLVFRQNLDNPTLFSIGQDGTVCIVKDGVVDPEVIGYLNHKNEVFIDQPDVTKDENDNNIYTYKSIFDKDGNILYDNIEKVGSVSYSLELVDVNGNSLGKTIAPSIKLKDGDKVIGNYNPDTGDVTDDEGNKQYEVYPDGVVTTGEDDKGHVEDGTIVTDEKGEWIGTYTPDNPEGDKLPGTLVLTGDPDDPSDDKTYTVDDEGDIHDPSITNTENGGGGNVKTKPEDITGPHGEQGGVYTPTGNPDDPDNGLTGEIKFTDPEQTYIVDKDGTIKDDKGNPIGKIDSETGDITWTNVIGKYDPETGKITDNKGDLIGTDSGDHKITDPETGETVGTVDPDTGEVKLFDPEETLFVDDDGKVHDTKDGGNVSNDPAMVGPNGEQSGTYTKADPENDWEGTITFTDPAKSYDVDPSGKITDPDNGDEQVGFISDDGTIHWVGDEIGKIDDNGDLVIDGNKVIGSYDDEFYLDWNAGKLFKITRDSEGAETSRVQVGYIGWSGTFTYATAEGDETPAKTSTMKSNGTFEYDGNTYCLSQKAELMLVNGDGTKTIVPNSKVERGVVTLNGEKIGTLDWGAKLYANDGSIIRELAGYTGIFDNEGNKLGNIDKDGNITDNDGKEVGTATTGPLIVNGDPVTVIGAAGDKFKLVWKEGTLYKLNKDENGEAIDDVTGCQKVGHLEWSGSLTFADGKSSDIASNGIITDKDGNTYYLNEDGSLLKVVDGKVTDEVVGMLDYDGDLYLTDENGKKTTKLGELKWSAQLVDEHGNVLADVTSAVKITDGEGNEIGYIDDEGVHLSGEKGWLDKDSNKVYDKDVNDSKEDVASAKKIGSYTTENDAVKTITLDGKTYQVSDEYYADKNGNVDRNSMFLYRIKDGNVVTDENNNPEHYGFYKLDTRYVETFETIAGKPYWDGVIRDANGNIIGDGHTKIVIKWNEGKLYNANDGREIGHFKWTGALYNETRTAHNDINPDTGVFTDFDASGSKYHYNYYVGGDKYNKLYKVKNPNGTTIEDKFYTEDRFKTDPETGNFVLDENGQKIKVGVDIVEVGYVDDYGNAYRYELKEVPYGDGSKTRVESVPVKIGTLSWSVDAVNNDGNVLIHFEKKIVIRDADGNVIATIDPDGTVRDKDGKIISKPSSDKIVKGEDGSIVGYIVIHAEERTIGTLNGSDLDDSTFVRNDSGKQIGVVESMSNVPYTHIIALSNGSKYFTKSDGTTTYLYDDNECAGNPVGFVDGNVLKGYVVKHYTDPEKNYVGTYDEKTGFIYTVDGDGNRKNIGEIDPESGDLTIYKDAPTKADESELKSGHVIDGTIKGGDGGKDIIGEVGTNGRIIQYGDNTTIGHIMSMTGLVVDPEDYDNAIGTSYNDEAQDHIVVIDNGEHAGSYYVSKSNKLYAYDDRNTVIGKVTSNGDIILVGDQVRGYLNPEDGRIYNNPEFTGEPIGKRDEDGAIWFTKSSGTISDIQIVTDGEGNPIGTYTKGENGIGTLKLDSTGDGVEGKTYYLDKETGKAYTDPECQNEVRCDYDPSDNSFGIGFKIQGTYGDDEAANATYEERTDEEGAVVGGVLTIKDTGDTYYVVGNEDGTYDVYAMENGEQVGDPIHGSYFDPQTNTFGIGYESEGKITTNVQILDADGKKIGTAIDQGRDRKQLVFDNEPEHKYDVANGNIYEDGKKVGEVVDGEIILNKDSEPFGTDDMTKKVVDDNGNTIGIIEVNSDALTPSNIYRADNDGNLLNENGKPSDNPEKLGTYVFDEELGNYVIKDNDGNVLRVVTSNGETLDPSERGRGEQGLGDDNYGEQQPTKPEDPNTPTIPPVVVTRTIEYKASTGGTIQGTATQTLKQGETSTSVTAVPANGYKFVKWSDGVTTPARTDSYDKVGSKTIVTANFEQIKVPPTMNVYAANASTGKVTLAQNKSFSLKGATVVVNQGLNVPITGRLTYTSSNPAIVKVDASGKIKADKKKTGSAKITIASVDNPANTKVITVKVVKKAKYKAIKALKKTNIKASYKVNKTVKVKVSKWNPSAPSNKNFTVTVSPKSKATLDPITNTVKFIGKGKVTITVKGTSEAKKIKVKVTVK